MRMKNQTINLIVILTIFGLFLGQCYGEQDKNNNNSENNNEIKKQLKQAIEQIYKNLQTEQVQEDQEFKKFPPQLQKQKGLYSSEVKLNLVDKDNSYLTHLFREKFSLFDNNMFVTNFVILGLIEADELNAIQINNQSLNNAINALLTFKDKNQKNHTTPIYNFWSQVNVNGTYQSYPTNLEGVMDIFNSLPPFLQKLAQLIGFDPHELSQLASSFVIPPDNDDSAINLALGSILRQNKNKYSEIYELWENNNSDYIGLYKSVKKYAYRPFNNKFVNITQQGTNVSDIIDPRTYYYLHEFINNNNQYPLSLFSTWLINQNDEISNIVKQPFHTNNVDMTVNANSLFGLNSLLTTLDYDQANELFDEELQGLYLNTTNLLAYGIQSGIVLNRTDLALTYYPSEYDFYWFVARNIHLLRSFKINNNNKLPFELQEQCLTILEQAMLTQGIEQILNLSKSNKNNNDEIYWEGFLGNYNNKTRNEDRLFSTAVTLNTLLDSYTITQNKTRIFINNTTNIIKNTIQKGIQFILKNYKKQTTSYLNTFFSGSVKGMDSLPFFYPSNYGMYINNSTIISTNNATMSSINDDLIIAFKGVVDQDQYQSLLNQTWFGFNTPQNFTGFNQIGQSFPFWSSNSITNIFMIQAFSKYLSVIGNSNNNNDEIII